jgi:hypothetical protein
VVDAKPAAQPPRRPSTTRFQHCPTLSYIYGPLAKGAAEQSRNNRSNKGFEPIMMERQKLLPSSLWPAGARFHAAACPSHLTISKRAHEGHRRCVGLRAAMGCAGAKRDTAAVPQPSALGSWCLLGLAGGCCGPVWGAASKGAGTLTCRWTTVRGGQYRARAAA